MGNEVSHLGNESLENFQWTSFNNRDLYIELSSPTCQVNKEICKKVCQNNSKSHVLQLLMKSIIDSWPQEIQCSNLLFLLKHFIQFVFSEKIPYFFLFEDTKKSTHQSYENSFHRLVPVVFMFEGTSKTVYVSIAQTGEFDRKKEHEHMIETIKSHFPEVSDYLLRHNEKIYLTDDNGKIITVEDIYKHYAASSNEVLIDPFKTQTKHFSLFRAIIRTMECDLSSPISVFLKDLIEKFILDKPESHLFRTHAVIELILALLSSQLYWLDKPIGRIEYKLFKHSPAVDILMNLPLETGQILSRVLLEYTCFHWTAQKKVSIFSSLLSSYLDLRLAEIEYKTPQLAAYLLLILNAFGRNPNPFRVQSWEMKWETISKFLFLHLKETVGLSLFTEISKKNSAFYNHILSLSEPEIFIEPMLEEIYMSGLNNDRSYLILVNLLKFSKENAFIKFIHTDAALTSVSWLKDYRIEKISLGSLMFLALTKVLRENLRYNKLDYLHVITVGCLFNISQSVFNLNELPSMEYLSLCKALYSKYQKIANKESSEVTIFTDLIHVTIEILARILSAGLSHNTSLVQAVLHHSDLFTKLRNSAICNRNITAIADLVDVFMKSIDSDNVLESIVMISRSHNFTGYTAEILCCKEFVFLENYEKWEEFFIPYLWINATKTIFKVPNLSRVVLFRHS